jgi:O-antigen/teichoic acid export membrane protein
MKNLFAFLVSIALRPEVKGIITTILIKALSILSAFLLFTLSARVLGEEQFGQFALFFSAASMLAVAAVFGQEMLIIRIWNENTATGRMDLAKGGIVFGLLISAVGATIGATLMALTVYFLDTFAAALSAGLFVIVAVFLAFLSSLTRTVVSILMGDGQRELTAFLPAIVVLFACLALGLSLSAIWAVNLVTLGMTLAVALQIFYLLRVLRKAHTDLFKTPCVYAPELWLPSSLRLWCASMLEVSNQYLDVILIGFLLDPIAAGAYFVVTRLANGFASVADAFNMFAMRQFPEAYYKRDRAALITLLQTLAILTALAVVCGLVIVGFAGHWLLLIFGEEYVAYYHVLLILCLGSAAMAATGPAAPVLMLTGYEGSYLRVVALSVFLRIAGFLAIVPYFGIVGAAATTTLSLIVLAVLVSIKSQAATGYNVTATRILTAWSSDRMKVKET